MSQLKTQRIGEKLLQQKAVSRPQLREALALQQSHPQRLGELLAQLGYIPRERIEQATERNAPVDSSMHLGELLLRKGWIDAGQLQVALTEQQKTEEQLGSLLLRKGWLDPLQLEQALTELLLQRTPRRNRRLGQILEQTRQISHWQLNLALQLKQALEKCSEHEPLGELLVRLNLLSPEQVSQALRLQKRLLRSAAGLFLGTSLLIGCKAPTVPLQFAYSGDINRLTYQTQAQNIPGQAGMTALSGPFKALAVDADSTHQIKIRVYQNGARVIENVPYARQGNDNTCGQAVITMLTNFWGVQTDYQEIVNQENRLNLATTAGLMVGSLRKKGLEAQEFRQATLDNLMAEINKGRPVGVLLDFGQIQTAHYVVVVGYNPVRGTLIMHDSLESPYAEMPTQTFMKMWENKSVRSIMPVGGDTYQRLMFQAFHPERP